MFNRYGIRAEYEQRRTVSARIVSGEDSLDGGVVIPDLDSGAGDVVTR